MDKIEKEKMFRYTDGQSLGTMVYLEEFNQLNGLYQGAAVEFRIYGSMTEDIVNAIVKKFGLEKVDIIWKGFNGFGGGSVYQCDAKKLLIVIEKEMKKKLMKRDESVIWER